MVSERGHYPVIKIPMRQWVLRITAYADRLTDDLFFFSSRRRHTRSLRDWSSDVCSSDLTLLMGLTPIEQTGGQVARVRVVGFKTDSRAGDWGDAAQLQARGLDPNQHVLSARSEERRVGKECRSRWLPYGLYESSSDRHSL